MGSGVAATAASSLPTALLGRALGQGNYPAGAVTLWSWGTPSLQEEWMTDFLTAVYSEGGITAEAVGQGGPGDIMQLLLVDFAGGGGTLPDMVQTEGPFVSTLAKAGVFLDLTDWVAGFRVKMPNGIFDLWTFDDRVYAFPWRPNTWMMYYNREIFDSAGVSADDIETWDDWIAAGIEIKNATGGASFLEYRNGGSEWHTTGKLVPPSPTRDAYHYGFGVASADRSRL